jgi:hypothetical protein
MENNFINKKFICSKWPKANVVEIDSPITLINGVPTPSKVKKFKNLETFYSTFQDNLNGVGVLIVRKIDTVFYDDLEFMFRFF